MDYDKIDNDNRLVVISHFYTDRGELRVNKLKMIVHSEFAHLYVDSGKTKDGYDKYANIRLRNDQLKRLRDYLNGLEID